MEYNALFVESSLQSIKAPLLHFGHKIVLIPIAYSVILNCSNPKMIFILLGPQGEYTKYPSFLLYVLRFQS